ncbi:MAG: nitrous oxide-stimulated promoter family protein [Schwartzia sp.]|nr:nitrous oxide-stimulated promoter family protein [Schwartzia sp. (in: firmicutes)]
MSFFSKLSEFIPEKLIPKRFRKKKDPVEDLKQNLPKEKANLKSSFAVYCNKHHDTKDGKLCPKCTALLAVILPKINRCPYGVTKPICDRCDQQCFGTANNKAFMEIMEGSRKAMLVKHPMMTVRHKIMKMGVDYAKQKQSEAAAEKEDNRRKEKVAKARRRKAKK